MRWLSRSLIALHFIHDTRLSVSVSASARIHNYNAASDALYVQRCLNYSFSREYALALFPSLHRLRLNLLLDHIMHVSARARRFANTATKWTIRWWILRFVDLCPSCFCSIASRRHRLRCLSFAEPKQHHTKEAHGRSNRQQKKNQLLTAFCQDVIELKHLRFIYLN